MITGALPIALTSGQSRSATIGRQFEYDGWHLLGPTSGTGRAGAMAGLGVTTTGGGVAGAGADHRPIAAVRAVACAASSRSTYLTSGGYVVTWAYPVRTNSKPTMTSFPSTLTQTLRKSRSNWSTSDTSFSRTTVLPLTR